MATDLKRLIYRFKSEKIQVFGKFESGTILQVKIVLEDIFRLLYSPKTWEKQLEDKLNYLKSEINLEEITNNDGVLHLTDNSGLREIYYNVDDADNQRRYKDLADWIEHVFCYHNERLSPLLGCAAPSIGEISHTIEKAFQKYQETDIFEEKPLRELISFMYGIKTKIVMELLVYNFRNKISDVYKALNDKEPTKDEESNSFFYSLLNLAVIEKQIKNFLMKPNAEDIKKKIEGVNYQKIIDQKREIVETEIRKGKSIDEIILDVWGVSSPNNLEISEYNILKIVFKKIQEEYNRKLYR